MQNRRVVRALRVVPRDSVEIGMTVVATVAVIVRAAARVIVIVAASLSSVRTSRRMKVAATANSSRDRTVSRANKRLTAVVNSSSRNSINSIVRPLLPLPLVKAQLQQPLRLRAVTRNARVNVAVAIMVVSVVNAAVAVVGAVVVVVVAAVAAAMTAISARVVVTKVSHTAAAINPVAALQAARLETMRHPHLANRARAVVATLAVAALRRGLSHISLVPKRLGNRLLANKLPAKIRVSRRLLPFRRHRAAARNSPCGARRLRAAAARGAAARVATSNRAGRV